MLAKSKDDNFNVILEMRDIEKFFPGVHALKKSGFQLKKGEVHALVGENGAGKSTLMKILAGIYQKDAGKITFNNTDVNFNNTKDAREAGISMVHQELNLLNHLTVAQNIFIGRESRGFFTSESRINNATRDIIDDFKININPTDRISELTVGKAQMVEIAKAMSFESQILILDEPTSSLSESETLELFDKVRKLKENGVGIIFITHRMGEIKQIADRITVMRDGEFVKTVDAKLTPIEEIIKMMVGRVLYEKPKEKSNVKEERRILEVNNISSKVVKDFSFELYKGEILGLFGLMGAGRTEVARLIFGADPKLSGEILVNSERVEINSPSDAVNLGIGYLSEDRKRFGLALGLSVKDNITLPSIEKFIIDDKKHDKKSNQFIDSLKIRTPSNEQLVRNLSGGNQQKVVVAKWLMKNSDILIFDEPTRGIDVGSKAEIYKLMKNLVAKGKSIIMISSELPEILRMSDRVLVMCEGRKTAELNISDANQETIMKFATSYENGEIRHE